MTDENSISSLTPLIDFGETSDPGPRVRHSGLRVVAALFWRLILIKIRRPSAIVEFSLGVVIWALLYVIWKLARITWPGYDAPPLNTTAPPAQLAGFFSVTEHPMLVLVPDCNRTRNLLVQMNRSLAGFNHTIDLNPRLANTTGEMESIIYSHTSNGVGIHWVNALAPDALTSPNFSIYMQAFIFAPERDLFELISLWLAGIVGRPPVNASTQHFATPPTEQLFRTEAPVAFFIVFPIILTTMPDLQTILDDKDSRVQTLSFLMGCSEAAYWGVSFLLQFMLALVPYTAMSAALTMGFMLKGTSFTLFYTVSVLFVIAHIWFQMFITTFMKRASSGRILTVALLVLTIFFSDLNRLFTLDERNPSEALKHAFSLVPLSAYQMVAITLALQCRFSYPAVQWSDLRSPALAYRPWYGLVWLAVDAAAYFALFVVLNLTMARDFGSPLLGWRDLLSPRAWRAALVPRSPSAPYTSSRLLEVEGLAKIYRGARDVAALAGVSFGVDAGEVVVVIGPNGAGKSTLMNILAGAVEPTAGTLRIAGGARTRRFRDIQRILGVCFQENVLVALLTVREHFALFGRFRKLSDADIRAALAFFAETLQLAAVLDSRAGDLSGGQKRKLCIALALLGHPRLVIMDEPTAGVDVQARQLIWQTIARLTDTTTIVTSHALEEAEAVSSRLFVVAGGKMPFVGTSTELRNEFKCGYVLRVEGDRERVLQLARRSVPDARMAGRGDTIEMPVSPGVPAFVREFEARKEELGVVSYSFAVEQLEDVLMKLIETEEAQYDGRR
jgi:ABC-type multidrug transport system ATPase subunit